LAIPGLTGIKNQTVNVPASADPVGPYKIVDCEDAIINL